MITQALIPAAGRGIRAYPQNPIPTETFTGN